MSLTTFLKNVDVIKKFSQEFPLPKFTIEKEILAPPLTDHYSLVGTAFDYLLRFYIKRLNPKAITSPWVAENSEKKILMDHLIEILTNHLKEINSETFTFAEILERVTFSDIERISWDPLLRKISSINENAKRHYEDFLKRRKTNKRLLLEYALKLAQIDLIIRAGYIDPNLGKISRKDVKDLKKLISIVNLKIFKAKRLCILNPTFGEASSLVGGADADILLDDKLIEIKTTKFLRLTREYSNQLIGYYILSEIGTITLPKLKIKYLGIYYSRHGVLYTTPVKEVINKQTFPSFIRWFKKRAKRERLSDQDTKPKGGESDKIKIPKEKSLKRREVI